MSSDVTTPAVQSLVMLHNLGTISVIMNILSILFGVSLFVGGLFQLKRYGEMRTFMSHQMTVWAPLIMMVSGVLLLMLPTTLQTVLMAFWGQGHQLPLAYHATGENNIDAYIPVVNTFVRVIGAGTIIRACIMLSRAGGQGSQPGTMGKAISHLFGGILCVHIVGTVALVKYIFDIV